MVIQHILTEKTEKHFFTDQILPPLLRGENVTIFWVPHGGMRTQMTFLAEDASGFGFDQLGKYKIVYINPYELIEESAEGYFSLMLYALDPENYKEDESKSILFCLKEKVRKLAEDEFHLIFILGNIDEINFAPRFFDNLYTIWQIDKTRIHFVFCLTKNIFDQNFSIKYGQLAELMIQNKVFSGIFQKEDILFTVQRLAQKYNYSVSSAPKLEEIVGGHPNLLKSSLRLLNKSLLKEKEIPAFLENQWEIKTVLEDIWNALSEEEKRTLSLIAERIPSNHNKISDYLQNLKIVTPQGNFYSVFSPLFETFIKKQKNTKRTIGLKKETGEILIDGFPTREKITLKEYRLLSAFLENPNKIFSRDEIAEILWGKEVDNKYSEWAIDQNISLLRKKLETLGAHSAAIQTIKGRGYRWLV